MLLVKKNFKFHARVQKCHFGKIEKLPKWHFWTFFKLRTSWISGVVAVTFTFLTVWMVVVIQLHFVLDTCRCFWARVDKNANSISNSILQVVIKVLKEHFKFCFGRYFYLSNKRTWPLNSFQETNSILPAEFHVIDWKFHPTCQYCKYGGVSIQPVY